VNLPISGRINISDVDELSEATQPWDLRISQLQRGQFHAVREFVRAGELILYREHFSHRLLFNGTSPPGYVTFAICLSPQGSTIISGQPLGMDRIASTVQSSELDFSIPGDSNNLVMLVPESSIRSYLEDRFPEQAISTGSLRIDPSAGSQILQLFNRPFNHYFNSPELLEDTDEIDAFESQVLGVLNRCITSLSDDDINFSGPRNWKTLLSAMEYLDATNKSVRIDQLASAIDINQRSLESLIKNLLGITPKRFEVIRRLNNAHRDLCRAEPDSTESVTKIASRWGFSELGRFAVEYRQLFGKKPSLTLKMPRAEPGIRLADFFCR